MCVEGCLVSTPLESHLEERGRRGARRGERPLGGGRVDVARAELTLRPLRRRRERPHQRREPVRRELARARSRRDRLRKCVGKEMSTF